MRGLIMFSVLMATFAFAGCTTKDSAPKPGGAAGGVSSGLPDGIMLSSAPADAKPLGEVKKSAKKGDKVTFVARVGGTKHPFVDGRATMIVIDSSLAACDALEDDDCATPWDYCCEPRESKTANSATVQIVGDDGKPLALSLKGQGGIEELVTITVVGVVTEKNDEGLMVVNASGVHVKKG